MLRTNDHRPSEVSMTRCPFPECEAPIPEGESFARHWEECPVNPENGGIGAFPSDRRRAKQGGRV